MKTLKRREFIKTVGAGSLGLAVLNNFGVNLYASQITSKSFMGGIAEFSVLNDVAQLAVAGRQVTFTTAELISADINNPIVANLSRMGIMMHVDESTVEKSLKKAKTDLHNINIEIAADYESQKSSNSNLMKKKLAVQKKLSLILGWYMASGIRGYLRPLSGNSTDQKDNLPSEMSIYQDMFVLKQVSGCKGDTSAQELATLFNGMQPRMICRTHTLTPDYDDGKEWTIRITNWRNDSKILMEKYARAYINPDKQKTEKYIHKMNFYNADDMVVQLARWVQDDKSVKNIENVLQLKDDQSLYAKAIISGIIALKKADKILVS